MADAPAAPPRALHVVGAMNVGGAETLLMNLYRKIDRDRVQFDFLVFGEAAGAFDEEIGALGGRILRLPFPRGRGVRRAVDDVRQLIRDRGPFAAVHAHVLHASAIAVRAARAEGVPIRIAHSHNTGDVPGGLPRTLYRAWGRRVIVSSSTQLVACGSDAGRYLFGDSDWTLLRNGVDLDVFKPMSQPAREELRRSLGVAPGELLLGSVARLEVVKNHDHLISVASCLRERGSSFRMMLVGEGSRRPELEARVRQLDLDGQVEFLGVRRDVDLLLGAMDQLVMPSLYEGIPVVLMEAQASGLPCLVSDAVSGEVDLGVGLVDFLPTDDPDAWAARILDLGSSARRTEPLLTEQVRLAGGDIDASLNVLYRLYSLQDTA